ncbi:MAG: transferase hexapeptide repeat containing protein [Frankiales bacterium]|nr:transferase hexapeptide repeat containing protein [Frankiales bacterium]
MSLSGQLRVWREEPLKAVAAEARLMRPRRLRQFASFGESSILHRPMWLYGTAHASVGSNCLLMHQAWLSVERSAWDDDVPALRIGDRVTLRPFFAVSASFSIDIEDGVSIGASSSVYDSNHVVRASGRSILDDGGSTVAAVRIGAGSWIGDRVTVLAGADIGTNCTIGAGAVVRGTIPDNSIAVGIPARVIGNND